MDVGNRQRAARFERSHAVLPKIVQPPTTGNRRHAAIVPFLPDRAIFAVFFDNPEADLGNAKILADHPRRDRHHFIGIVASQQGFGQRQLEPVTPRRRRSFKCGHCLHRQRLKPAALHIADPVRAGFGVQHADGADRHAFAFQHGACIKPQALGRSDQWVAREAVVAHQVRNNEGAAFGQCNPAYRNVKRQLALADADLGLEPLAIVGNEIDHGNRRVKQHSCEFRDAIEHSVSFGIENMETLKRRHSGSNSRIDHGLRR